MGIASEEKAVIRQRMLDEVDAKYDKTTGSFFWDTLDPVAAEIKNLEANAEAELDASFAATAEGEDLDRVAADRKAMYRKTATKAVGEVTISGAVGASVPLGLIVTASAAEFSVTAAAVVGNDGTVTVPIMCTVGGSAGNVAAGAIRSFGVSHTGLYSVTNEEATEDGYDRESDEALRVRLLDAIRDPGTSGNAAHYRQWALSVAGVGGARVIECWNGNGTVKVVIISAAHGAVGETIVKNTADYIESQRPTGASVTVVSAAEKSVSVAASVTLAENASVDAAYTDFLAKLADYLNDIAFKSMTVSYARVGALLLSSAGVEDYDYENLTINGSAGSLALTTDQVGVVGTVTLNVG